MEKLLALIPVLCSISAIFIFILLIIVSILWVVRQNIARQKAKWQQLATELNRRFGQKGEFVSQGDCITGNYQGYPLKIVDSYRNEETYTRIVITIPYPDKQPELHMSHQEALNRLNLPSLQYKTGITIKIEANGKVIFYEQPEILKDMPDLDYLIGLLVSLAETYPVFIDWGGEAIPFLQTANKNPALKALITGILRDIGQDTTKRLALRHFTLLCPDCLTRFGGHQMRLSWGQNFVYYGCRTCKQSRRYLVGQVIAVLDSQMTATPIQQDNVVKVNWIAWRKLFDFDAAEIVQATDEDVERFAVQVGNDTNMFQQPTYKKMICKVNSSCPLSANTIRILQHTFGQVEVN